MTPARDPKQYLFKSAEHHVQSLLDFHNKSYLTMNPVCDFLAKINLSSNGLTDCRILLNSVEPWLRNPDSMTLSNPEPLSVTCV